ncbi:TlpA disulfide reductase family protein [Sphingobacterium sp. DR205]|uniref:TlpA family protein disulfide reductase n=1 Tax=Sphingobacterium sp. DR205 TaxID=2713573 RepID=UPI0013E4D7C0|nr:TlpA disulfide reductase family protein [Sphingobacterium sp. DR205]QIH34584.1 TlpA family protein disulfide reductase [Sphingobacterium sp. DR205]
MADNKDLRKEKRHTNILWESIKKNGFTVFMGILLVTLFVSPDAKSWMLQQLMNTGIFNASLEKKEAAAIAESTADFEFKDQHGLVQHTSSLRGKVVFINFWASWCPPCRAEFPSIEFLYSKFKDHPQVFFLTINEDDDLAAANAYLKKEKFSIPFFKATGPIPHVIYNGDLPTTVVLDKNGKIRFHHEGFADYSSDTFVKQLEELIKE